MSLNRMEYPDPFLDVASTKLPKSREKLLELCFLFATTHPQISPIVKKLSKYPITRVIVNTDNGQDSLKKKWEDSLEWDLNIYEVSEGVGLDFFGYGNCFVTIHRPFRRFYICNKCDNPNAAGTFKYYLNKKKIHGKCPHCNSNTTFEARDDNVKIAEEISIVRLQPQNMRVERNEMTGKSWYFYDVPKRLENAVGSKNPNRDLIDTTPWKFVKAAMNEKQIKFKEGKVLHLSEPALSGRGMAWGNPIIMAALKDAYLNQIYKKADESMANERVVPARFVFPQATSQDPLRTISLSKFSSYLQKSLTRWRQDKNAVMPAPFPVGVAEVGGDAQRFTTAQLRQLAVKEIIGSTGVPEGFLADGMTWSGGSVQLRMLENMLMSYLRALNRLVRFVIEETSSIMGWPLVSAEYKPFRMADDTQMLQILIQLAQMKVVSYKEILDRMDLDWSDQHSQVREETKKMQEVHIQDQLLQARTALRAADIQVESQMRSQGYQGVKEEMAQDDQAMMSHFQREGTYHQLDEQMEQQKQQQEQQQQQMQQQQHQTQMRVENAKAQKYQAEAEQKGVHADMAEESVEERVPQVVQSYVEKLMGMPPEDRGQVIGGLRQKTPKLAARIEERLAEEQQREEAQSSRPSHEQEEQGEEQVRQQAQQQQAPQRADGEPDLDRMSPPAIDRQLRRDSKNVSEYADKLKLLPRHQRLPVFEYVRETDPEFLVNLVEEMGMVGGGGGQTSQGNQVDMRPAPQQKPPRRKG